MEVVTDRLSTRHPTKVPPTNHLPPRTPCRYAMPCNITGWYGTYTASHVSLLAVLVLLNSQRLLLFIPFWYSSCIHELCCFQLYCHAKELQSLIIYCYVLRLWLFVFQSHAPSFNYFTSFPLYFKVTNSSLYIHHTYR